MKFEIEIKLNGKNFEINNRLRKSFQLKYIFEYSSSHAQNIALNIN